MLPVSTGHCRKQVTTKYL